MLGAVSFIILNSEIGVNLYLLNIPLFISRNCEIDSIRLVIVDCRFSSVFFSIKVSTWLLRSKLSDNGAIYDTLILFSWFKKLTNQYLPKRF